MMKILIVATALLTTTTVAAHAQASAQPSNWFSLYGLMYTGTSNLRDPDTNSDWRFDDNAFGLGASLHRQVARSLMSGVDASFARPEYERVDLGTGMLAARGTATIATAMANGRYGYAGGGDIGFYLTGGLGTVAYRLEDLDSWNADFALHAGTGLEYRFGGNKAVALEWGRTWGYHEEEGVGDGRQTHSALKLIGRIGF